MEKGSRRIHVQLVSEFLEQVMKDARPQPARSDRSRQQIARIARRLRERRQTLQKAPVVAGGERA
jgi:hypothetical protein